MYFIRFNSTICKPTADIFHKIANLIYSASILFLGRWCDDNHKGNHLPLASHSRGESYEIGSCTVVCGGAAIIGRVIVHFGNGFFFFVCSLLQFSIEYPSGHKDIFFFIDSVLMGLQQSSASRILLQNFIKSVQKLL